MKPTSGCKIGSREPKRRLPDPGLPGDDGDQRQLINRVDEIEEGGKLLLPPDEIRNSGFHVLQQ